MHGRGLALGLMAMTVMATALCLVPGSSRADWIPDASLLGGFSTVYPDEYWTASYVLENGKDSSVDVTEITAQLDWESSAVTLLSSTVSIPAYGSYEFSRMVMIPQSATLGSHEQTIEITGQAVGDWWSTTGTWTDTFAVESRPPLTVSISANPNYGTSPLVVSFTSIVSGGTPDYQYYWDFGDGAFSYESDPSHTYQSPGVYSVTLTVHDLLSRQVDKETTVTVIAPVTISMSVNATSGPAPLTVQFTSSVSGGKSPYSYDWDFGDGESSSEENPSHTYASQGEYTVTLTVTDSESRPAIAHKDISVSAAPPPPEESWIEGNGLLLGGGIVVVAVIIAVAVYLSVRKGKTAS